MTYNEYTEGLGSMTPVVNSSQWRPYETEKDVEDYVNMYSYAHINPTSTQIDVDSVLWQLNNNVQRPGQKVTKYNLMNGQPWQDHKLIDQREVPRPTPIDPSSFSPTWDVI